MKRGITATLAVLFWLTIGLQFYISFHFNRGNGLDLRDILLQFVSFFTNDTALLIALTLTLGAVDTNPLRFWNRPSTLAALTLFIIIVATVYAALLQGTWSPQGLQLVADRMLHVVLPTLFVLYWLFLVPKGALHWTDPLLWQVYPAIYMLYIMERGQLTGRYPYPFLNINRIGTAEVIINGAALLAFLIGVGMAIVTLDQKLQVRNDGGKPKNRAIA